MTTGRLGVWGRAHRSMGGVSHSRLGKASAEREFEAKPSETPLCSLTARRNNLTANATSNFGADAKFVPD